MTRKLFKILLLAAATMCCNAAWALYGTRGGSYHGAVEKDGCLYYLYQNYSYSYEGTERSVSGYGAVLTAFKNSSAKVSSSVTYGGRTYNVVAIGEQSYDDDYNLPSSVTIPNTVEVIEAFAFDEGRSDLVNITMADGSKDLFCYRSSGGSYTNGTFSWNTALKTAYIGRNLHYQDEDKNDDDLEGYPPFTNLECTSLEVTIGPQVTEIPDYCFYYPPTSCSITKLITNNATSLRTIGKYAFWHNKKLEKVGLANVQEIKNNAFDQCDALKEVYLFSNSVKIAANSFSTNPVFYVKSNRVSLTNANNIKVIPENQKLKYQTTDGKKLSVISGSIFDMYEGGEGTVYFDNKLTEIGRNWGMQTNVSSLVIPSSVTKIGGYAFGSCSRLTEIYYLGDKQPQIEQYAFNGTPPATIYVGYAIHENWSGTPVRSWRSGKGDGTKNSPYEIENYINLYGFSLEVQEGRTAICGKLTKDIVANSNVLNGDGSLNNGTFRAWLPIGGHNNDYKGEFNGDGHTISGLYVNNEITDQVGLFGKAVEGTYIHDLGVENSYFCGNNWVAGICGDFAFGKIENCWNGATVISKGNDACAGGIAGSCWVHAAIANCHNVGKVSLSGTGKSFGGICGSVYKSDAATYTISNCYSLEGKCSKAYNLYQNSNISNVSIKSAEAFRNGEVCWLLNGSKKSTKWRQHVGHDAYPTQSGEYFVYYTAGSYQNYDEDIAGSGTKDDPFRIGNEIELVMFANIVNGTNPAACGILISDIEISKNKGVVIDGEYRAIYPADVWQPIGTQEKPFAGEFNGNGHVIKWLYVNDVEQNRVGLFGKAVSGAYIHNLGVKDSYFKAKSWVAGICGDLAGGKIENCWSSAIVQGGISGTPCAGGIAASCWTDASVTRCYNIGKVSVDASDKSQCGDICGVVARNANVDYSVSNCVSFFDSRYPNTKVPCNLQDGAKINNVTMKDYTAFRSGEVCWIVNGSQRSASWRQQLGESSYPAFTGNYIVYKDETGYHNETVCEKSANHIHIFIQTTVTKCDESTFVYCHCTQCGKDFLDTDRTKEITGNVSIHDKVDFVEALIPTLTTAGHYEHYHCRNCGKDFLSESYEPTDDVTIPAVKNNEIWYTTTDGEKMYVVFLLGSPSPFGAKYISNKYNHGLGTITFDADVTTIGQFGLFSTLACRTLQSITIPGSVTSIAGEAFKKSALQSVTIPKGVAYIGEGAFESCDDLRSITFTSFPSFAAGVFAGCNNLTKVIDLTDSDKPYISSSTENYPGFTEINYRRTLESGKWGTIVLPFKPAEGTEGLEFYELKAMTLHQAQGGQEDVGSLSFTKAENIVAGTPYLFRSVSDSKTRLLLTKQAPVVGDVDLTPNDLTVGNFTMKGCFQAEQFDGASNRNLYYLKDNEFFHANGQIDVSPFRAYIEGNGNGVKSLMLIIEDGETTAIPGIMDADGNIDETEAIYDISGRKLAAPQKGQINIIRTKSGKTIKRMF